MIKHHGRQRERLDLNGRGTRVLLLLLLLLVQIVLENPAMARSTVLGPYAQRSVSSHLQTHGRSSYRGGEQPVPRSPHFATSSLPPSTPDFNLSIAGPLSSTLGVGSSVLFSLNVCNTGNAAEAFPDSVSVSGVIPVGLRSLSIAGAGWQAVMPTHQFDVSPVFYRERYVGGYPIAVNQCLPTLMISGILTADAIPLFTLQGTAAVSDDFDVSEKFDCFSVTVVSMSTTSTVRPVTTSLPLVTATIQAAGVSPTSTPSLSPSPSPTPEPSLTATASSTSTTPASPTSEMQPTATSPAVGTVIPTATIPPTNLLLQITTSAGSYATVGSTVTFAETICNTGRAVTISDSIELSGVIPLGLADISIGGPGWSPAPLSMSVGPVVYDTTYTGTYPVDTHACLPTLTIAGTIQDTALPALTLLGVVSAPGDVTVVDNSGSVTLSVLTPAATPTLALSPTSTPTPTPTASVSPVPIATSKVSPAPNLVLSLSGPSTVQVGQVMEYTVNICNMSSNSAVNAPDMIAVNGVLPLGMNAIKVAGVNWQTKNVTSTIGPALLTIAYAGPYPVLKHQCLSPLFVSGIATVDAQPNVTVSASVTTPNDSNVYDDSAMFSTRVAPALALTPTVSISSRPAMTPTIPDFGISIVHDPDRHFRIGQSVQYHVLVCSSRLARQTVDALEITGILPLGLSYPTFHGNGWGMRDITGSIGPLRFRAVYQGGYPVARGICLPALDIQGTLNGYAVDSLTTLVIVSSSDSSYASADQAVDTLFVLEK